MRASFRIFLTSLTIFLKGEITKSNFSQTLQNVLKALVGLVSSAFTLLLGTFIFNVFFATEDNRIDGDYIILSASGICFLLIVFLGFAIFKFGRFKYHSLCGECSDFKVISHINSQRNSNCEESEKLINGYFREADDHNKFINEVQMHASLADEDLNLIRNDIRRSVCGRFLCVVTNQDYLEVSEAKMVDMFEYFLSTFEASQKNYIARAFCIPAEINETQFGQFVSKYKNNGGGDENDQHSKNIVLFKYLLINQIAGTTTYLQIHKKGNHRFFPNIDYVLAAPLSIKTTDLEGVEGFKCSNRLYFSYTRDIHEKDHIDKILFTKDACFVKIFENEFYYRLPSSESDDSSSQAYQFPMSKSGKDYRKIINALRLSDSEVNESIQQLDDFIRRTRSSPLKETFVQKLNEFKL